MANYTFKKRLGIISIFLMILMHCGWCKSNNCDVKYCKTLFPTLFADFFKKGTRLCRSSDDTIECADICFLTFFPELNRLTPKASIASEFCSYDIEYDLNQHWNCISSHFHRLLTCVSMSGSMTPTDISSKASKQLPCKKLKHILDCPYNILGDCAEEAIEVVNKLFSKVFMGSMKLACKYTSLDAVQNFPVTYSVNNSFLDTAACLDKFPNESGNCFTEYFQDFDSSKLYNCSYTCGNPDGVTCLPPLLMRDFYIPVFSFGKQSCKQDSPIHDQAQMNEPSETYIINNADLTSVAVSKVITSTVSPTNSNENFVRSAKAKKMSVSFTDYINVESFTLNAEEMDRDKESSTDPTSNIFPPESSVTVAKDHTEIVNSISSEHAKENHACKLGFYLPYLIVNVILVIFF